MPCGNLAMNKSTSWWFSLLETSMAGDFPANQLDFPTYHWFWGWWWEDQSDNYVFFPNWTPKFFQSFKTHFSHQKFWGCIKISFFPNFVHVLNLFISGVRLPAARFPRSGETHGIAPRAIQVITEAILKGHPWVGIVLIEHQPTIAHPKLDIISKR